MRSYEAPVAVEVPVIFDGRTLRIEFDRATVLDLMHERILTSEVADAFLHRYRTNIEVAIEAHLYAQGVPLDRHVVISMRDFNVRQPM
jgi:hypothetical protein